MNNDNIIMTNFQPRVLFQSSNGNDRSKGLVGLPLYLEIRRAKIRLGIINVSPATATPPPPPPRKRQRLCVATVRQEEEEEVSVPLITKNQIKRCNFWRSSYPHGIADIPASSMIDIGEMRIEMVTTPRHFHIVGQSSSNIIPPPIHQEEEEGRDHGKLAVLMAISGVPGRNERFVDIEKRAETGVYEIYNFIETIIKIIGPGTNSENRRCFTMASLPHHEHPMVLQLILCSGHRYVFRAPSFQVDGPVEHVLDTIENDLEIRMMNRIHNNNNNALDDVRNKTIAFINSIDNFADYFYQCGFRD